MVPELPRDHSSPFTRATSCDMQPADKGESDIALGIHAKGAFVFDFFEVEDTDEDLVVGGEIIVELKAVKALEDIHYAQVKSYLKATNLHVGLLLNFNAPALVIKRIVL